MIKPVFRTFFSVVLLGAILVSCNRRSKLEKAISEIPVEINVERFDQLFANASVSELPKLKEAYPFMFSKRFNDSVWINRMQDTLHKQLSEEVKKAHGDFSEAEDAIQNLFQHLKYYYKEFREPRVITVTNYVEYRNRVIVTDSIVLVALDNYLGADHEFYQDIYKYVTQNLTPSQIVPDMTDIYARRYIRQLKRKTLLDEMVYAGKTLYFKDIMLPNMSDERKIGYSKEELEWAQNNEGSIWQYFVERELLFSTDSKLPSRFINPAPFSKFNLELDSESPGRTGQYIGWQIVKAYAKNNDASLQDILDMDAETLFNNSKFKPRK